MFKLRTSHRTAKKQILATSVQPVKKGSTLRMQGVLAACPVSQTVSSVNKNQTVRSAVKIS